MTSYLLYLSWTQLTEVGKRDENNENKYFHLKHSYFCPHLIGHIKSHDQVQSQRAPIMKPWQGREKELGTILEPNANGSGRTVVLHFYHLSCHSEKGLRKYVLFGIWANFSECFQPGESWGLTGHFTFHTVAVLFWSRLEVLLPIILSKNLSEFTNKNKQQGHPGGPVS